MVDEGAQQDKLAHAKPRHGYGCQATQLRIKHPIRDLERTSLRLPNQGIVNSVMLVITDHQHGLTNQRMKRVGDHGFECQKPGTMAPARTTAGGPGADV